MCEISKGVLSQLVETIKIKGKSSNGESSWGVTGVYGYINQWVFVFDRKI